MAKLERSTQKQLRFIFRMAVNKRSRYILDPRTKTRRTGCKLLEPTDYDRKTNFLLDAPTL